MFVRGQLVRYREGTAKAGEVYFVRETQYLPTSSVMLSESLSGAERHWANPTELERVA